MKNLGKRLRRRTLNISGKNKRRRADTQKRKETKQYDRKVKRMVEGKRVHRPYPKLNED